MVSNQSPTIRTKRLRNKFFKEIDRRAFLRCFSAGLVASQLPGVAKASDSAAPPKNPNEQPKIIWVMLRGGLDSIHTVVPADDPDLMKQREILAKPIMDKLLPLDKGFGLHPELGFLHELYRAKQMSPVVAVASPYRSRSHFDAQDMLESGLLSIDYESGWLSRAMRAANGKSGLALARSLPISMRGSALSNTWYPDTLSPPGNDLYERLLGLYQVSDDNLYWRLLDGLDTREKVGIQAKGRKTRVENLMSACGKLMAQDKSPDCAMLEMGGWDTHNNQENRLSTQFKQLNHGLTVLKRELGASWKNTIIVVASEFGRTVKNNGTRGTDHGTASTMLLLGGALKGGEVLGQWPGLSNNSLYEGRDLQPTSDIRSWMATLLSQHWHLNNKQLASVFPEVNMSARRLV